MVNIVSSTTATWTSLSAVSETDIAQGTSVAAFNAWPTSVQVNFVKANGTGTPPSLVIGPDGGTQAFVSLTRDLAQAQVLNLPAKFSWYPDELTANDFESWPDDVQLLYFEKNASGTPLTLNVGPVATPLVVTQAANGALMLANSTALTTAEAALTTQTLQDMSAAEFFSLTPSQQYAYYASHSAQGSLRIGAGGTPIILNFSGNLFTVSVPTPAAGSLDPNYSGFNTAPGSNGAPTAAQFEAWPTQIQQAYVAKFTAPPGTYPATVFLPGASTIVAWVTQSSATAKPAIVEAPSTFQTWYNAQSTSVGIADFMNWPPAAQLLYIQKKGSPATLGSGANIVLTATLNAQSPVGFTLTATLFGGTTALLPNVNDLDLLQLLSPADQADYFNRILIAGTPKVIAYPSSAAPTAVVTAATDPTQGVVVTALPSGFTSAPASLDPATFLGWSPQVQNLYLVYKNTGGFDAAAAGASTPTTIGAGASTLTATFTGLSGTALIIAPPVQSTAGMDPDTIPYYNLPGGQVGAVSAINNQTAQKLFPTLDGVTNTLDKKPDGFNLAPSALDPAVFGAWHSASQLEYLKKNGGAAPGTLVTIGPGGGTQIHAFVAAPVAPATTGTKVYVIENLQKQDIAKMPLADQNAVANAFAGSLQGLAQSLGLIPDGSATATNAATALATIQSQIIQVALNTIQSPTSATPALPDGYMPQADKDVFTAEINNIATQLQGSAVFSVKDINDQINTIMTRFQRANAFSLNVNAPGKMANNYWSTTSFTATSSSNTSIYTDPLYTNSTSIVVPNIYGYLGIIANSQSTQPNYYHNVSVAIDDLTVTSPVTTPPRKVRDYFQFPNDSVQPTPSGGNTYTQTLTTPVTVTVNGTVYTISQANYTKTAGSSNPASLDGNASIAQSYQTFMTQEKTLLNLQNKAINLATTGRITNQALDLPNLIFLFQLYTNLSGEAIVRDDTEEVNQTNELLKMYGAAQRFINRTVAQFGKDDGTANKGPVAQSTDPDFAMAVKLFDSNNGGPPNPIETLKGITRPRVNLHDDQSSQQWQQAGTALSDTVTLINQDSQLKMNDINSMTKQKDRNFDLANNALSKMYDVLQKIAGATA